MSDDQDPRGGQPGQSPKLSKADKAVVRKIAGASFGDRAMFDLPSGRTVDGAEMRRLVHELPHDD